MKTQRNHRHSLESGNALWIILIALALLATLTITVTRSSDTTEDSGNTEQNRIAAGEIIRYAQSVEQIIQRMQMNGISENDISFENDDVSGYENANCTTGDCKIFDVEGGGLTYKTPKTDWLDKSQSAQALYGEWFFPNMVCVSGLDDGTACTDGDSVLNEELVIILPYIKKSLCIALNKLANVTNPGGTPPQDDSDSWLATEGKFAGTYDIDGAVIDDSSELTGQKTGCFEGDTHPAAGSYHFYHVLISR